MDKEYHQINLTTNIRHMQTNITSTIWLHIKKATFFNQVSYRRLHPPGNSIAYHTLEIQEQLKLCRQQKQVLQYLSFVLSPYNEEASTYKHST